MRLHRLTEKVSIGQWQPIQLNDQPTKYADTHYASASLGEPRPGHTYVVSPFAPKLAAMVGELKNIFDEVLDSRNKYDFYDAVALAAQDVLNREATDSTAALEAMIEAAARFDRLSNVPPLEAYDEGGSQP